MPISIIDNFDVNAPKNIDARLGPYDTTANALASIDEVTQRYLGLTVLITGSGIPTEYWFQDGVTDSDLVLKPIGSAVGFPYSGSDSLNNDPQQALITGSLYLSGSGHITASGDISASGNLFALASDGASISHVALYNTSSGQFFYTASNALSTQANTLQQVTDQGNTTTNDIIVTGSLFVEGQDSLLYVDGDDDITISSIHDVRVSSTNFIVTGSNGATFSTPNGFAVVDAQVISLGDTDTNSIELETQGTLRFNLPSSPSVGDVVVAQDVNGNIKFTASSAVGASTGSFLTTASADFSEITFTKGDASTFLVDSTPRRVIETVKNLESFTLPKGTPVYASGSTGNAIHVYAASASLSSRMPAAYVLNNDLTSGQEGIGILTGFINGVNTSAFASGDVVYVGANGGYTNVKPTGSNLIQNLGKVVISDAVNGSGVISGAGRANDVPNLLESQIFFGSGSNQAQQIHISGALDTTVINNITASGDISSSATVYGLTGSFGTSTTTITDNVVTTGYVSASGTLYGGGLLIDGNSVLSGSVTVHATNVGSPIINFENDGTNSPLARITGQSYGGGVNGGLDFLYHNGTSLTEAARLRNGNLGIGTTNPTQKLEVAGNISASGYISASNGFIGDGSGLTNLPAGATPTLQQVVTAGASAEGDIKITGSLTISGSFESFKLDADDIVLGSGAGEGMTSSDQNNIIVGTNAVGSGNINGIVDTIAIGHSAGYNLTTGDNNILIGSGSGDTLTTGYSNIMIGDQADGSTSNTYQSIVIGTAASITGGTSGVAIGNSVVGRNNSVVIGGSANTNSVQTVTIGPAADSNSARRVDIGNGASGNGYGGIAIGYLAISNAGTGVAIGYNFTNALASSFQWGGGTQKFTITANSNVLLNNGVTPTAATHFDDSATNVITIGTGSAPDANVAHSVQLYAQTGSSEAGLQLRTSGGTIHTLADKVDFTNATAISGSTFSGSFVGDGSGLTNIDPFPYTGDAVITGSLVVTGSIGMALPSASAFKSFGVPGYYKTTISLAADAEIFRDENIRIEYNEAATDQLEGQIYTDPSSGLVDIIYYNDADGSYSTTERNVASGEFDIDAAFTGWIKAELEIYAPNDNNYPYYHISIISRDVTSNEAFAITQKFV